MQKLAVSLLYLGGGAVSAVVLLASGVGALPLIAALCVYVVLPYAIGEVFAVVGGEAVGDEV